MLKRLDREFILKAVKGGEQNAVKITRSENAADYARHFYADDLEIYESFFIILLNRANNTIGWAKISQGGIASTVADVRLICKYAIESLASGVVIVHNHPSGNLMPSEADKGLAKKIQNALKMFDVELLDSIILTADSYRSFVDSGLL